MGYSINQVKWNETIPFQFSILKMKLEYFRSGIKFDVHLLEN